MHANLHYAMGIIIASLYPFFFSMRLDLIQYMFIVFCAFGVDFDILFRKFAEDNNHRNLPTHTIYPALIIIILGFILSPIIGPVTGYYVVVAGGFAYLSHIILDLVDWGLYLFGFKKMFGLYILLTQDEKNIVGGNVLLFIKAEFKKNKFFFIERYYSNPIIIGLEIVIGCLGAIFLFAFSSEFGILYVGYLVFLEFHLYEKKKASEYSNKMKK